MVMTWKDKDEDGNPRCRYCEGKHDWERCPRIENIEYHQDGRVKRVQFKGGTDVGQMVPEESESSSSAGGEFRFGGGTGADQDGGLEPTEG